MKQLWVAALLAQFSVGVAAQVKTGVRALANLTLDDLQGK